MLVEHSGLYLKTRPYAAMLKGRSTEKALPTNARIIKADANRQRGVPGDAVKRSWDPETAIHETEYYCDKSDLNQAMFYSMFYISGIDYLQNSYVTTCLFLYY